jgi:hypothetical protein
MLGWLKKRLKRFYGSFVHSCPTEWHWDNEHYDRPLAHGTSRLPGNWRDTDGLVHTVVVSHRHSYIRYASRTGCFYYLACRGTYSGTYTPVSAYMTADSAPVTCLGCLSVPPSEWT